MKMVSKQMIDLFYGLFSAADAIKQIAEKGTRETVEESIKFMFDDLMEIATRVVGIDGSVAFKEVSAINELFKYCGYNTDYKTNWLSMKMTAPTKPPKTYVSKSLKTFADAKLTGYKYFLNTDKPITVEECFAQIDSYLFLWTSFMCEIIIADRKFTDKERDLLIAYITEFCKYVSVIFGKTFLISENVQNVMRKAIILCHT